MDQTHSFQSKEGSQRLFVIWIKPHLPVSSASIARWLKACLEISGIETSIFKAHSIRSASASAAKNGGVTTREILQTADWSTESVFQKFYYKTTQSTVYSDTVLSNKKS